MRKENPILVEFDTDWLKYHIIYLIVFYFE